MLPAQTVGYREHLRRLSFTEGVASDREPGAVGGRFEDDGEFGSVGEVIGLLRPPQEAHRIDLQNLLGVGTLFRCSLGGGSQQPAQLVGVGKRFPCPGDGNPHLEVHLVAPVHQHLPSGLFIGRSQLASRKSTTGR